MNKVLCFVSNDMADFEVTLALHLLKAKGSREIVTVGCDSTPVVSQAGFTYHPNLRLHQALDLPGVEALIIPGGPIRVQPNELTQLILKVNTEKKLLAAICFGPQHFGRAGVLENHRYTTSCSESTIQSLGVLDPFPRHNYANERVVRDENVITATGSAFVDFAFAVCDYLHIYAGRSVEKENLYNEIMGR